MNVENILRLYKSLKKEEKFSIEDARKTGDKLDVDWSKINQHQLHMGMNHELEHAESLGKSDAETMAKIAVDHQSVLEHATDLFKE